MTNTENPRVGSSILSLGTTRCKASQSTDCEAFFLWGNGIIIRSLSVALALQPE